MQQGYLVAMSDGRRMPVVRRLVIGRGEGCEISLDDGAVSRKHVEIRQENGGYYWQDLESTNGTKLNGRRMTEGKLQSGDRLLVGNSEFRFDLKEEIEPAVSSQSTPLFQETFLDAAGNAQPLPPPSKTAVLLNAVYTVVNAISSNYEPCQLLDQILETTVGAISAQRGAVFLSGPMFELQPCPECGRVHSIQSGKLQPVEHNEIHISHSIARRVLEKGESVLYEDAGDMTTDAPSASIISLKLRSVLCVPLRSKEGILGILYFDTDCSGEAYTEEDMLLASAVGNSAGLALENARMHLQMLEKQRIDQDIATAWSIQQGFLVKDWPTDDPRYEVYGETRPAKTVGGDFYDFVQPGPDCVGLLIGDVSGKGVPAALTMAQMVAEFRLLARELEYPSAIISELNSRLVARSQRGMFCTLCYLRLDLTTGHILCANAGHHPVMLFTEGMAESIFYASSIPVGIMPDARWDDDEYQLRVGDVLLMYTDGISEARRKSGGERVTTVGTAEQEYGSTSVEAIGMQWRDFSLEHMLGAIFEDVAAFTAPHVPHDDCTMLAARYKGNR